MRVAVKTKGDCAEDVTIECGVVEWLIINKALRLLSADTNSHITDRLKAKIMCEAEPTFEEINEK